MGIDDPIRATNGFRQSLNRRLLEITTCRSKTRSIAHEFGIQTAIEIVRKLRIDHFRVPETREGGKLPSPPPAR